MKLLIINGPNLNMLGIREKNLYGDNDYKSLVKLIRSHAKEICVKAICYQSNHEGDIVTAVQNAYGNIDGIVINAGAYTHTSIAILDALKSVSIPTVEVHITDVNAREDFRKLSYISMYAEKTVCGKGFAGYTEAMDYLKEKYCK